MLEKYGENDENIPESDGFSPRTPTSPAYSAMYSGGGGSSQHGGSGGGGGKFIPQIPSAVLENYLNSKYGVSPKHITETTTPMSGLMTGGGGSGVGVGSLPTMNIPVVATMPMAGMMPIQQAATAAQQQALQQSSQQQGSQQSQQSQQQGGGTGTGTGASQTNEPNAQGVKTFSIRM